MSDLVLESIRAGILLYLLIYLVRAGKKRAELCRKGWSFVIVGFGLLFFASLIDITDNFKSLNRLIVIGDTPTQAFLEKMVGFLCGFIVLTIGLVKWIPTITSVERNNQLNEELKNEITERKRVEDTLRKSEEKYRGLFDESIAAIYVFDEKKYFMDSNQAGLDLLGYSKEKLLDMSIPDVDADPIVVLPAHEQLLSGNRITNYEHKLKRKDGSVITVLNNSRPLLDSNEHVIGIQSTLIDITDRKRAEEAAIKAKEEWEMTFNSVQDLIMILDDKYRIIRVNKAMADSLGVAPDEAVGLTCYKHVHGTEKPPSFCPHTRLLEDDQAHSAEIHEERLGGYFLVDVYPFHDTNDRIAGCVHIAHNITARIKLEKQLRQAQKMESIGSLAGGVAHDFNNILSPIIVHSEMAMMDLPSESPLQQNIREIYKAGERARDLVKQILTFARRQENERVTLKTSQILKESIKLLRSTIPTIIDIQYEIDSEQDIVFADPTQLNQIIMNLCTNAAHAMEEKGGVLKINLTNENLDSESANEFQDLAPGHYIKLSVRDTGQGIEPQFMAKIFEPYFTTKAVGKGTGMGLALVHGIVKSHGGTVTVQSKAGKGTTFHVYLPLVEEDTGTLETAQDVAQLPEGTGRILFVDDENAAVSVMQSMLGRLGFKVTARTSSIEALEAFRNNPQEFDLVITDMAMPNMTGKELAQELMAIRPDIPIILCTGFSEMINEKEAKEMGIRAFVMKPIVMREMANMIREVLDKK